MNLGTQTASLVNHLYSRATIGQPEPTVGMGAALLHWTDRTAATVIGWDASKRIVTVQEDHAIRTDTNGMSEQQVYEYTPNQNGSMRHFRRANDGGWRSVRFNPDSLRWVLAGGNGLRLGDRDHYHDPSF